MPFEIPENIHPLTARLAWLIGHWAGNGHGEYPTIDGFQFGQEVVFQQDGRPFIHYFSRAWIESWILPTASRRLPRARLSAFSSTRKRCGCR